MKRQVVVMLSGGTKWTFSDVEDVRIRFGILTVRYAGRDEMRFPLANIQWWDSKYEAVS